MFASPCAVFHTGQWDSSFAQPIGPTQYLRIDPQKCYSRNISRKKKASANRKMKRSSVPVQLAFADIS